MSHFINQTKKPFPDDSSPERSIINLSINKKVIESLFKGPDNILSLFRVAFKFGSVELASHLFERYPNLSIFSDLREAFFISCEQGYLDMLIFLIPRVKKAVRDGTINITTGKHDRNGLILASREGHLEVCQILLEAGIDYIVDKKRVTALTYASKRGYLDICKLLFEIEKKTIERLSYRFHNYEFISPLIAATYGGRKKVCKFLLEKGLEPDHLLETERFAGSTPFSVSIYYGHPEVCELFLKHMKGNYDRCSEKHPMLLAAKKGQSEICKLLHRFNFDLQNDSEFSSSYNPFLAAIKNGHLETCKVLLDLGANPFFNIGPREIISRAVLILNLCGGDVELFEFIIGLIQKRLGAYDFGLVVESFVEKYLDSGGNGILRVLLEKKYLDPNYFELKGSKFGTLLCKKIKSNDLEACRLLCEFNANVNLQVGSSMPPIFRAIKAVSLEIFKLLVENGADLHIKYRDQCLLTYCFTTLTIMPESTRVEFIQILLEGEVYISDETLHEVHQSLDAGIFSDEAIHKLHRLFRTKSPTMSLKGQYESIVIEKRRRDKKIKELIFCSKIFTKDSFFSDFPIEILEIILLEAQVLKKINPEHGKTIVLTKRKLEK